MPQAESLPQDASIDWVDIASDFIPIYGDIKSFAEAQTGLDYAIATAGVFLKPVKAIKAADKIGDAAKAAKKVGKAAADKADDVYPSSPLGSSRNQMNQPKNPSYQSERNKPTNIGGRDYTAHALDRMQDRGIPLSVVENTIKNGKKSPSRDGTFSHYDSVNNVTVITNNSGGVVMVRYGK